MTDYRIVFAGFVVAVFLLYRIRSEESIFWFINRKTILSLLMAGAVGGTVISFIALMTDQDPTPLLRRAGYYIGLQQLVSYEDSIPPHLTDNLAVRDVLREDLDGDGFSEWVVFYQFDAKAEVSPLKAVVYDNDRGDPPVVFPYPLSTANSDYLSEGDFVLQREEVIDTKNGPDGENLAETFIYGYPDLYFGIPVGTEATDLTIFKYEPQPGNSWDQPTTTPARYVSIGRFHGDGGVTYNAAEQEVVVVSRQRYERSQLAMRQTYSLNSDGSGFMDPSNPAQLAPPTAQTIDFYPEPPNNIYTASFPELTVLAYYAANCNTRGEDLCRHTTEGWVAKDFLGNDNLSGNDFGLNGNNGLRNLSVLSIEFKSESDPNTLLGQQGETSLVTITFKANDQQIQTATLRLQFKEGRWKIIERVNLETAQLGG